MVSPEFIERMPKVELHVHLEGSIQPETVLELSRRNQVALPADTLAGLREWYQFTDPAHFFQVYFAVSKTIRTAEDIELIAREFLVGQANQNILHSEVTYTASTLEKYGGIPWPDQLEALTRAREFGEKELGVTMLLILDIVRGHSPERAMDVARWAVEAKDQGVCALGLAGDERLATAGDYREAIEFALDHGQRVLPHAGEGQGAESVAECLHFTKTDRIGHGVRCLEDDAVVGELNRRGVTLEVCPTSNICLQTAADWESHPLPKLMERGLKVTINSDDPPMFNTSLTREWQMAVDTFGFDEQTVRQLGLNAAQSCYADPDRKEALLKAMTA